MASKPNRTPAPDRPPPPVPPPPPLETPPPGLSPSPSPSPPGEAYHTPTPSLGEASPRAEASPQEEAIDETAAVTKSPQLSPMHFPSPHRLPPPGSPASNNNGQEGRSAAASRARPQLRLATGLLRTPSQGSVATNSPSQSLTPPSPLTPAPAPAAKSPSSSSSPSPPSPLTPAAKSPSPSPQTAAPKPVAKSPSPSPSPPSPLTPAPPPAVNSGKFTPKHAEAWKPQPPPPHTASPAIATQFDADEEAASSPLRMGKPRLDQQRRTPAAAENGGAAATGVPPDVAAVAKVGDRRALSVALRLATAVLSLAAFSVMVSARTTGWAGDYYGRHLQYRYAVGVNVIVCAYSIAQSFGEIRRLISTRFIFRSMSSYYFSLFLDQVLAYLLMSASSAAASRNDLWVSRFGTDPFNKKINSALWLSFIAFMTLAVNALISTANLFSMV